MYERVEVTRRRKQSVIQKSGAKRETPLLKSGVYEPAPGMLIVSPKIDKLDPYSNLSFPSASSSPTDTNNEPMQGVVLAYTPSIPEKGQKRRAPECSVGDTVLYDKWGGTKFTLNGKKYVIVREYNILAVVRPEKK